MKTIQWPLLSAALLGSITFAHAGLTFTIEDPGVQASPVPGVIVETFDSGSPGAFSGSIAVGSLSVGGAKVSPDAFGGSLGSQYYAVGAQSGATEATLALSSPQHYFGMWWAAGDMGNRLEFYNGSSLLAAYAVGDIIPLLSAGYFGNPNNGLNALEPYVYLDFTTTGSDEISSVKFINSGGSGYEMDNFSVTDAIITPPGTPPGRALPDGGSTFALLGSAVALGVAFRRQIRGY
jgi:hypothetical protein